MKYINKMIETYEKETKKTLTEKQKEVIKQVILNSKIIINGGKIKMKNIEKIKKFEKVIKENQNTMLQIIVLYNMSCSGAYEEMTDEQKEKLLGIIYNFYIKDESFTDLGHISDIVMENHKQILSLQELFDYEAIKQLIFENL